MTSSSADTSTSGTLISVGWSPLLTSQSDNMAAKWSDAALSTSL